MDGLVQRRGVGSRKLLPMAIASLTVISMGAQAFEIDTGNPDLTLRWDNTVKYNLTMRAQDQDKSVLRDGVPLAQLADDADLT